MRRSRLLNITSASASGKNGRLTQLHSRPPNQVNMSIERGYINRRPSAPDGRHAPSAENEFEQRPRMIDDNASLAKTSGGELIAAPKPQGASTCA